MRPEFQITFPTLYVSLFWSEHHCVVPDSFDKGAPWVFRNWQTWVWLNFYRLRPDARASVDEFGRMPEGVRPASAFTYRRSQIVLPQKAGKAPYTAAHVCNEAVGPAVFAGWATGTEVYECAEHGCPCGWVYEYEAGEAMGVPWPTPLIQITATSEDQTGNIYDALRPMIDNGPLSVVIPKTGEEFIRLPGDGEIATVTSNALSRLGQRVTFVPQDETGIYVKTNGMIKVAETQRRGLAGMGGRAEETTNGWDPTEDSVAQRTSRAQTGDIFRFHPLPEKAWSYRNKADRRKIHRAVYLKPQEPGDDDGTPWIDLDAIEGEAAELLENDAAQAERFFGNRIVAGGGPAFDLEMWESLKRPGNKLPAKGATITIGVDGARYNDALAVVACEVESGFVWPLVVIERPDNLAKDAEYEHDRSLADGAVREAFDTWNVWRLYADPQYIDYLIEGWKNEFGEKRVLEWQTYRPRQIAWAVRNLRDAVKGGTVSHPGIEVLDRHVGNAKLKEFPTILDDRERPMHTLDKESKMSSRKIDAAMALVLAWEARSDAIKAGAVWMGDVTPDQPAPEPKQNVWVPGQAPDLNELSSVGSGAEFGDLS